MAPLNRLLVDRWRREAWRELREALQSGREPPAAGGDGPGPRLLEVGVGTGHNARHARPRRLVAADRSRDMLRRARTRGYRALAVARAERLPFDDGTFAGGLETLAWCEVDGPRTALSEVRRVLRAGATFVMLDHVRPPGRTGRAADLLSRWTGPAFGEWWNRDTRRYPRAAGFRIRKQKRYLWGAVRLLVLEAEEGPGA